MDSNGEGWWFLLQMLGLDSLVLPVLVTLFVVLILSRRTIMRLIHEQSSKPVVLPEELKMLEDIIAREREGKTNELPTIAEKAD